MEALGGSEMTRAVYAAFFLFIAVFPLHAYIDPGTGSMLFSLITGVTVTVFFFLKNLFIKLKTGAFLGKKKVMAEAGNRERLVIFSEGRQYWNVFKPVVEELSSRKIRCAYYSADDGDPGLFGETGECVTKRFIGSGNEAYRFLNFLEASLCLMTTPNLDVFQLKRSPGVKHYSHIVHTVTDTTTYRLFGLDYFDSVLLSAEFQKRDIRKLEELRGTKAKDLYVVGCTYLDVFQEKLRGMNIDRAGKDKTVLAAPSWGKNGILRRYGLNLLEPLVKSSYHLIIRPHPQSMLVERDTVEKLQAALASCGNVEWNFDAENLAALARADVMLSDFSGVIFDYAFLFGRPVVYPAFEFDKRPYDLADTGEEAWVFRAIRELGEHIDEKDFGGIEKFLDSVIAKKKESGIIEKLKQEGWMYPGEAGKRTVDALESILEHI
jgi:hypothetical protein